MEEGKEWGGRESKEDQQAEYPRVCGPLRVPGSHPRVCAFHVRIRAWARSVWPRVAHTSAGALRPSSHHLGSLGVPNHGEEGGENLLGGGDGTRSERGSRSSREDGWGDVDWIIAGRGLVGMMDRRTSCRRREASDEQTEWREEYHKISQHHAVTRRNWLYFVDWPRTTRWRSSELTPGSWTTTKKVLTSFIKKGLSLRLKRYTKAGRQRGCVDRKCCVNFEGTMTEISLSDASPSGRRVVKEIDVDDAGTRSNFENVPELIAIISVGTDESKIRYRSNESSIVDEGKGAIWGVGTSSHQFFLICRAYYQLLLIKSRNWVRVNSSFYYMICT